MGPSAYLKKKYMKKMYVYVFRIFSNFIQTSSIFVFFCNWKEKKVDKYFFSENKGYTRVYWDIILSNDVSPAQIDVAIKNYVNSGSTLPGTSPYNVGALPESYYQGKYSGTCFVSYLKCNSKHKI